jgi:chorismate synthase
MFRFLTAGESHGKALAGIIEGIPSGLALGAPDIDPELKRRQRGYGRGGRMKIESDSAEIVSGVRWGRTTGAPITLLIKNSDWENWKEGMSPEEESAGSIPAVTRPRPGHADLSGALKYNQKDIRNILERSSARETAMRVALGAVAKKFLLKMGIHIGSFVVQIGPVQAEFTGNDFTGLFKKAEASDVRCPDKKTALRMKTEIDKAIKEGNSLGGRFIIFAEGVPPGMGSHTQWDRKLDGLLAQAIMSIQAIKAVEIGAGARLAGLRGSDAMDEIFYDKKQKKFTRETNRMGGIEGGMTNGMPVVLTATMKPIPTLRKPLRSVDIVTKKTFQAAYERSDVCAVPAASVVGESMAALVLAGAFLEKFGGDSIEETGRNHASYRQQLAGF